MFYSLRRAGRALQQIGAIDFATTIAPGPARRAAHRQGHRRPPTRTPAAAAGVYDAVVLDAPPTGRITRFLNVNAEVAGLARVGPVRRRPTAS